MESLESLLRDEFRASEGIDRSSVADLIASTRRGGRRRTIAHVAASIVVIAALVAVVATAIVRTTAPRMPAVPTPPPSTIASIFMHPGQPTGGRFVDRQHGFLTFNRCSNPDLYQTCRPILAETSDGGSTFHELALPSGVTSDLAYGSGLYAFDATHLVIAQEQYTLDGTPSSGPNSGTGGQSGVTVPARHWISSDAGHTWTEISAKSGQPMTQIPAGAPLVNAVDTGAAGVLTADGVDHPLTTVAGSYRLPLVMSPFNFAGPTGGSYFVFDMMAIGEKPASVLRVSRDNGRTWQAARLPEGVDQPLIIGSDGGWIYASSSPSPGVLASSDGGLTWRLVDLPKEARPQSEPSWFVISPQGGLLYADRTRVWRLTGAGTFYRLPEVAATLFPVGLGSSVAAIRVDGRQHVSLAVSTDGSRWSTSSIR